MEEEKTLDTEQEKDECCCRDHEEHEHHHDHEEHEHHHDHEGHEHHHHHDDDDDDCCCGHDHDHEGHEHHHHDDDDDDCCCGHDHDHEGHEHHHHDDDDDDCCCGHDHDHEGHEHHHHHHDHGHKYDVPGFRIFETHNHEGATICSFEKDVRSDSATVVAAMETSIKNLEKWLDETDATIGHVKGYVKEAGPTTTFSTVGYGLNVEKHDAGNSLCVGFASIVFGPTEEELKDKVAEIFAAI